MKIALIVPGGVDRSGEDRVIPAILSLVERLARRHEVRVYALAQEPSPGIWPLLGATVENLALTSRRAWPGAVFRFVRSLHAHGPFDLIHAIWGDTPGFLASVAGKLLRVPVLVHFGGGELARIPEIGYGSQLALKDRFQVAFTRKHATLLTAASRSLAGPLGAEAVPLGVDTSWRREIRIRSSPPWKLLHVASLNPVKDQPTLLRALRRVVDVEPETFLEIAGVDTLSGAIERECERLGLSHHVRFHGLVRPYAVQALFEGRDLLVVSSRHEAGPVAAVEAAMSGVPVVGTAVGHLADWAGEMAETVPVGDDAALASAILALLRDPVRRETLACRAQAWALLHDADATARRFEELYFGLKRSR